MNTRRALPVLAIALFLIGTYAVALLASTQLTSPQAKFTDLTLKLSSSKDEFLQLEPVPLGIELVNETDVAVVGHKALDVSARFLEGVWKLGKDRLGMENCGYYEQKTIPN